MSERSEELRQPEPAPVAWAAYDGGELCAVGTDEGSAALWQRSGCEIVLLVPAAELRRLHAENETLREILDHIPKVEADLAEISDCLHAATVENEALRADAERLDWCIALLFNGGWLTTHLGCGCCADMLEFPAGTTGRAAIDAARSKK